MGESYFNVSGALREIFKDRVTVVMRDIWRCLRQMAVLFVSVNEKHNKTW
jgi:hypothetical protein